MALGAHLLPTFLCQCSVSRVFKATATRNRGKSKQASIEWRGSNWRPSSSECRAPTDWVTSAASSVKKSCKYLDCVELFLIHLFWDFWAYFLSFETDTALKVAIKSFCLRRTLFCWFSLIFLCKGERESTGLNCAGAKASSSTAHVESICPVQGRFFFGMFLGFFWQQSPVFWEMDFATAVIFYNTIIASTVRQKC